MKIAYIVSKNEANPIKTNQKNTKAFNYGLAILKTICEFLVVVRHNFSKKSTTNKIILGITSSDIKFHVPCFCIMSFYFMYKNLLSLNPKIILNRLMRLLIPYIGWPIIILKMNHFWNKKYNTKLPDSYEELKLQLLWGHNYSTQFWFLWNLIAITILFTLIISIFRKHFLFIFYLISLLFYIIQYSGYNYNNILSKYGTGGKGRTFAFFFETLPFSVTGFSLGYFKIIDLFQKYRIKTVILSVIIYYVIENYKIFTIIKGSNYQGIEINLKSTCLFIIFCLFPSNIIKNRYISKFLIAITNYTAGVYYLHFSIRYYLREYFDDVKKGTFKGIIMTYLICYFISFIGMLIFGKTPLKYRFC